MKRSSVQRFSQSKRNANIFDLVTKNPAFKRWFADSEITDSRGHPLLMYHGTYLDFDAFASSHVFHCFTPDPRVAEVHAKDSHSFFKDDPGGASIIIMPVYLRVLRPFDPRTPEGVTLMEKWGLGNPSRYNYAEWEGLEDLEIVHKIQALGFDGIWMRLGEPYNLLAVFHPDQVKSATGNSGRFDPQSASLTDPI